MIVRAIQAGDFQQLRDIHEKFYDAEFNLPDFVTNFAGAFVIEDGQQIITICSLRRIAEVIAVTNKDLSVRRRVQALLIGSEAIKFLAQKENFDQIHAFVQDEAWESILLKAGFNPTKGKSLVLNV